MGGRRRRTGEGDASTRTEAEAGLCQDSARQRYGREVSLWRLLRSRRLASMKFRRQVPIGPRIVDFVSFEQRLIVEADGSPHAESEDDKRRDYDLSERGFRVLRFWNNDILLRSQSVLEMIFDSAALSPPPRSPPCRGPPPPPPTGGGGGA